MAVHENHKKMPMKKHMPGMPPKDMKPKAKARAKAKAKARKR